MLGRRKSGLSEVVGSRPVGEIGGLGGLKSVAGESRDLINYLGIHVIIDLFYSLAYFYSQWKDERVES